MAASDTAPPEALPDALQGTARYTYADHAQRPEGTPYELIHGRFVTAPAPTTRHQRVVRNLFRAMDRLAAEMDAGEVLFAPVDVSLSETDTVQPDVLFVATDRLHLTVLGERIHGAPDGGVEVFSPSIHHAPRRGRQKAAV